MLALTIGLAVAVALSMAIASDVEAKKKKAKFKNVQVPISQDSTVAQSGQAPPQQADQAKITGDATPFTFSNANTFTKLDKVTITATIQDGDTGAADLDRDNLTLVLDGIDTGVKLNDFPNGNTPVTNTVSGDLSSDVADQVLQKLKEDGKLAATIKDSDPNDNPDILVIIPGVIEIPLGNQVTIPAANQTTLKLDGKQTIKKKIKKKHRRH